MGKPASRTLRAVYGLLLLVSVRALQAERLPSTAYTTADGLPHRHINRIVSDSRGFVWFCTRRGLSRFDGQRFLTYGVAEGLPIHPSTIFSRPLAANIGSRPTVVVSAG